VFGQEDIKTALIQMNGQFAEESSVESLLLDPLTEHLVRPVNLAYAELFNELYAKHMQREKLATADDMDVEKQLEMQFQRLQLTQKSLENQVVKHFCSSEDKNTNKNHMHVLRSQISDILCQDGGELEELLNKLVIVQGTHSKVNISELFENAKQIRSSKERDMIL